MNYHQQAYDMVVPHFTVTVELLCEPEDATLGEGVRGTSLPDMTIYKQGVKW